MVAAFLLFGFFVVTYLIAEYKNSAFKWQSFLNRRANPPSLEPLYGSSRNHYCKYCFHPSDFIVEGDTRIPEKICVDCKSAISIITIGPDYRDHRGGIGAVLEVYSNHIPDFNFIASYRASVVKSLVYMGTAIRFTYRLITNRRIKIVHLHNASKGSFLRKSILLLIAKVFRKKVILHVHGAKFDSFYDQANPLLKRYMKFVIEKANVVICLSQTWKAFFESRFRIRKLEVLNNIVERADDAAEMERSSSVVNFLFLGKIGDRKGIFDLVTMLNDNDELFRGKYSLSIGGNGEVDRLKSAIKDNPSIRYVGWVKGFDKQELLKNCDVYILPSYNEGLPISVLEAMSYGKPIISTTVGGIPEIVTTEHNGWLFTAGDLEGLKAAFSKAVNTMILDSYGANSLAIARNYHPDQVIENLNRIYSSELFPTT